jgi:NAD(P) transhydrogenase subunit alpha
MLIAVPAETDPGKGRVAATPETVKKFIGLGAKVVVQAGLASGILDADSGWPSAPSPSPARSSRSTGG